MAVPMGKQWGSLLAHYAAVCAVGQFLVCFFTVPGVRTDFAGAFDPPVKSVPAAAAGKKAASREKAAAAMAAASTGI